MKIFLVLLFCLINFFSSLVQSQTATYVFKNGKVYTVNKSTPWAEAIAIKDNKIIFVGNNADAEKYIGTDTKVTDLKGKMLMPGFVDGHNHYIMGGLQKSGLNLDPCSSKAEMLKLISQYVKDNPEKPFYFGFNWSFLNFGNDVPGIRQDLDKICKDKPMLFVNEDSHHGWFNTKAMEMGGVTKETKDPIPGTSYYYKRESDGTPSGIGIELESWLRIKDAMSGQSVEMKKIIEQSMEEIYSLASKFGVTAYHEMGILAPTLDEAYVGYDLALEWEKEGKLPFRVFGTYGVRDAEKDPEKFIPILTKWSQKYNTELVHVNSLKIWADGTMNAHTGLQIEPYFDKPETNGVSEWTIEVLAKWIGLAQIAGFDTHIHSEGDGSVRRTLDAIEIVQKKYGKSDRRDEICHTSLIHPDDFSRFKSLGVGGNITPVWLVNYKGQMDDLLKIFGQKKMDLEYGIQKKLMDEGVNISSGSDIPGTDPDEINPLFQIQSVVTGNIPGSRFGMGSVSLAGKLPSLEQMVYSYTYAGAYQLHMEDKIGSIEVGKYADIIILDKNIFEIPINQLVNSKVMFKMVNGKIIYNLDSK
ncbi:MAG: amidohydrolase [Ignavibacteria bacterium]|nr:amidohydrolase [Ignavibacteria bacterium]